MTESPEALAVSTVGDRTLRDRLRGGRAGWAIITPAVTLALSLATYSIATRLLSAGEFGQFAVGVALAWILIPFMSLGAPVLIVRQAVPDAAPGSNDHLRSAASLFVASAGGLIIALACVLWVLGSQFAWGSALPIWPAASVGAAAIALTDVRAAIYQSEFSFGRQCLTQALAGLARLAGVWVAVRFVSADGVTALAGYGSAAVVASAVMLRAELIQGLRIGVRPLLRAHQHLLRPGVLLAMSGVLAVATTQIDTLVAGAMLAADPLAGYAAATRLSLAHSTVIGGAATLALPVAAAMYRQGESVRFVQRATALGLMVGVLAMLASLALGGPLTALLFGPGYGGSVPVFYVLSLGFLLNYPGNPVSQLLYISGRTRVIVTVQILQLVAFLSLALWLLPADTAQRLAAIRSGVNLAGVAVIIVAAVLAARASTRSER